ncbi:MAG: 4a-hydroxytetrahydrobiopterin dehydratase [Gemmatimonadales bacterium]|jgi:4a-hydroxytetrahydrobiopterin dehydratase
MSSELAAQQCIPCQGGIPALAGDEIANLLERLGGNWAAVEDHHLRKEYAFPNFVEALAFTNRVGEIAESQGHHPDIYLTWGKVRLEIWTHKIDGLTVSDFILAAKADEAIEEG